jgi:nucleotidyltransferase/DNA polymerase involved in DNA repair
VVRAEEAEVFLAPLSVRKLLWVGRKTEQKLAGLGVRTVGELARFDPAVLIEVFGVVGTQLYLMAHAIDESPVEERGEVKSISRERTFEVDTSDFEAVLGVVDRLSEMVHEDVVGHSMFFRTVTVKLRYENFETHLRGKTLPRYTNSLVDLKKAARELTKAYLRADRAVRLVGVKVSNFTPAGKQKTLI